MTTARTWTETEVVDLLNKSPKAVNRAILAIDARQTASERLSYATREQNGVGWSQYDARFGGWLAGEIRGGRPPFTAKMRAAALKLATRYRRQLVDVANKREARGDMEAARTVQALRACGGVATPEQARAAYENIVAILRGEASAETSAEETA